MGSDCRDMFAKPLFYPDLLSLLSNALSPKSPDLTFQNVILPFSPYLLPVYKRLPYLRSSHTLLKLLERLLVMEWMSSEGLEDVFEVLFFFSKCEPYERYFHKKGVYAAKRICMLLGWNFLKPSS
ncbi:hypothetical protein BLNAU_8431 [Blattamonas nauphoetae]|uniref:Uncharacterized protein n=1 Tax=Blattamonas nauphoetae TaxID=2049346 RepID=A0ABQ9XYP5_9EUKA|nr:hypothetical protein BLNAU_8431 [Blattamonas nauphoetae]